MVTAQHKLLFVTQSICNTNYLYHFVAKTKVSSFWLRQSWEVPKCWCPSDNTTFTVMTLKGVTFWGILWVVSFLYSRSDLSCSELFPDLLHNNQQNHQEWLAHLWSDNAHIFLHPTLKYRINTLQLQFQEKHIRDLKIKTAINHLTLYS